MRPHRLTSASLFLWTSLALGLVGCSADEPPLGPKSAPHIELIQADLVGIEYGQARQSTPFSGSIRAVQHSSVQAQVTATATQVHLDVGQQVKQGQVLAVLNNQDHAARLAQAQANLAATQAQANQAKLMMQRKKRLLDQGFIAQVEYEKSVVDYQAQQENVYAQQANVNIAQKAKQDGVIRSPITGVITKRHLELGQTVTAGQTLFEIIDPSRLELQGKVPTEQQQALTVGNAIEYRIQGQPNTYTATLSRIAPLADVNNRQIEFFASLAQTLPSLSIGAFVEGEIVFGQASVGQLLPLDVIHNLDSQAYVWVIRNGKVAKVNITVLEQNPNINQAVVTGLGANDRISRVRFSEQQINHAVSISQ